MNVRIAAYVTFDGLRTDLYPLLDDIANTLVKHGFGNSEDSGAVVSLLVAGESGISEYATADDFAKMVVKDAYTVLIPLKEETNDSTGKSES